MLKKNKLGFGTCQLGGVNKIGSRHIGMGSQKKRDSIEALNLAFENGVIFYDTADIYGNGKSEKLLGEVFKKKKKVIICSKIGNEIKKKSIIFNFSKNYVLKKLIGILRRLKRKKLDILLVHSPPSDFTLENDKIRFVKYLKKKGLIRNFGISFSTIAHAKKILKDKKVSKNIDYIEVIYNILDRRAEGIFKITKKLKIKVIARMPYANGFLIKKNFNFKKNDFRNKMDSDFISWIKKYQKKLSNLNIPTPEIALRFFYDKDNINYVIPGMRNKSQVLDNIKNFNKGKLNKKHQEIIKKFPISFYKWS